MSDGSFKYGEDFLTVKTALALAEGHLSGILSSNTRKEVLQSRSIVEEMAKEKEAVYGINTGFGPLCSTRISSEQTDQLQRNILESHSVGVGSPIPAQVAKLMMILKVHSLAKGFSGISLSVLDRIIYFIEKNIIPVVPAQGSVGASGDLAPLAHLFLPLIGLGRVVYHGESLETEKMLRIEGLTPLKLRAKEGLALINGTQFIAAYAVKVIDSLYNCLNHADLIGALMVEGQLGSSAPFSESLHEVRPFSGAQHVAARISQLLKNSQIVASHSGCERVQDPYSLRCIPQVHGASRAAWLHLKELVHIELNSVTDNPVITKDGRAISGGNFHGQPLAMALDYCTVAASEIGNISDRRIYLSLMGFADNVPKLLMKKTGINSGFMILQYTSAALASENKSLCFPASADSIPTSLGQEDHVSMGSISGRKALQVTQNVEKILAIELICAAQSFDFHLPLSSSETINQIHSLIRKHITHAEEDRLFALDIEKAIQIIQERMIIEHMNKHNLVLTTSFDSLYETY